MLEYLIPDLPYQDIKLHLTYSGFRRSLVKATEINILPATQGSPRCFEVTFESGVIEYHMISKDLVIYLLKQAIDEDPSEDDNININDYDEED